MVPLDILVGNVPLRHRIDPTYNLIAETYQWYADTSIATMNFLPLYSTDLKWRQIFVFIIFIIHKICNFYEELFIVFTVLMYTYSLFVSIFYRKNFIRRLLFNQILSNLCMLFILNVVMVIQWSFNYLQGNLQAQINRFNVMHAVIS